MEGFLPAELPANHSYHNDEIPLKSRGFQSNFKVL